MCERRRCVEVRKGVCGEGGASVSEEEGCRERAWVCV